MNAFQKYGLDAMGIDDCESFNEKMIKTVYEIFGKDNAEDGFSELVSCLEELYKKAERVSDGLCYASKMFSTEDGEKRNTLMKKVFEEISKVWHYNLEIVNSQLRCKV